MSTAAPDGGRSWSTRIEPELLGAVEGVLDSPDRRNAVSVEGEEVDLVDVLEASARGRVAAPLAQVGGRACEATDDGVALGHELNGFILMSGKERRKAPNQSRTQAVISLVNSSSMTSSRLPFTVSSTKRRTFSLLSTRAG